MIPPFIEICGRRNGKKIERDIIGSLLYSYEFMQKRGVAIVTTEEKREYEKVRNKYESPFALNRKTDAEIAIEQAREIDNLKKLANEANEVIKKLDEENKALVEENAKLKKESKTLTFESDGGLFNIEYQGMKFKATKVIIREGMLCNRVMEITANSVSE